MGDAIAAPLFGLVKRAIGGLKQIGGGLVNWGKRGNAQAGGNRAFFPGRVFDLRAQPLGQNHRAIGVGVGQNQHELFAAITRQKIGDAHRAAQNPRHAP